MKKLIALVCAVLVLVTQAEAVEVEAASAALMEKETGTILYAKDQHAKLEPASVTKVMTILLTMEAIDAGQLDYDTIITASAQITLEREGKTLQAVSIGDGPIDAAFRAIDQIIGHHYELDDFQIQSVTEGREAMGQTVVKLRSEGRVYSGRGISTDIVGASILAYINALNKIVYEEETV